MFLWCDIEKSENAGWTNLSNHVYSQHKNFESEMEESKKLAANRLGVTVTKVVRKKSMDIYKWLKWITELSLPFNFVEQETTKLFSNLSNLSTDTLMKYLKGVSNKMCDTIAVSLPSKFGIVIDGWDDGSGNYYVAIYAVYSREEKVILPLLACQPLTDAADFGAQAHMDLIESTLELYGKQ